MNERANEVINRIDKVLDTRYEFVSEGIIELLEDAQIEIGDLLREVQKLTRLVPKGILENAS
jgi:tRNA uridine 5-carbamoylmethylation protein Kti12